MRGRTVTVLTSVDSLRHARRIARALVEGRLAACVHIDPIESVYRWDGRLRQEREFRLVAKSTAARSVELRRVLRELHPYDVPAIYVLTPTQVDRAYQGWVAESCVAAPPARSRAAGRRGSSSARGAGVR